MNKLNNIVLSAKLAFDFNKHGDCQEYIDQYKLARSLGVKSDKEADETIKELQKKLDKLDCLNW